MEETHSFMSLLIVVLFAFITPILLNKFRIHIIPIVVAEIIAGLIIGESGFDIVNPDPLLETLSTLGFIYLLFLSGLEIDFSIFTSKRKGKNNNEPSGIMFPMLIFAMMIVLSFGISWLFVITGFIENAYLMTLVISTISLGIVVPTLKDTGIIKSGLGQTILLITVIADLATMILLGVFVSFFSPEGKDTWLLLLLFIAGVGLYFLGKAFRDRPFLKKLSKGTIQLDTRAVFTLIIVLVALSQQVGAESILGAFLAGALVSLLAPNPSMVQKLDSFGYGFLIPIFFVMIGARIDLVELFKDPDVLILMPFLLVAFMVTKIIPILWFKKWYRMKTVMSIGILLSSKLTLVIAAAEIGERMGMIDARMSSAIILVGVISCIIGPIFFKKLFPRKTMQAKRKMAILGANSITLPLSHRVNDEFQMCMYHLKSNKIDPYYSKDHTNNFEVTVVEDYELESLERRGVFNVDVILISTEHDELNERIARGAKERNVDRVITRIELDERAEALRAEGIEVFSTLMSTITLLDAMIKSPHVMSLFTSRENSLSEVIVNNSLYAGEAIKRLDFLGDTIIVRIFRNNESIVPHGDTDLKIGDRLIVTGGQDSIHGLKEQLEY